MKIKNDDEYICKLNERKREIITYLVYSALLLIVLIFHEPWFDEAQSWQIAKCANLYDIIFKIPHYEGHPSLWWILLLVTAKIGVNFETGLKITGYIISLSWMYYLEFRSPFPKYIKIFLPFSYFLFYQYGVITRPYGLLFLELLILADKYPYKYEHPYRYSALLILPCITSAYGLIISGGIAICILIEICKDKGLRKTFIELLYDPRTKALIILLAAAILVVLQIKPAQNTYATSNLDIRAKLKLLPITFICLFFSAISDCLYTTSDWFSVEPRLFDPSTITLGSAICCIVIGFIIITLIYFLSSKKSFKYFVIPYSLFILFGSVVYLNSHHIGIALLIIIFWLWITLEDKEKYYKLKLYCSKNSDCNINRYIRYIRYIVYISIIINAYWTLSTSTMEIQGKYVDGRGVADFIRNNGLENTKIVCFWNGCYKQTNTENSADLENTNMQGYSALIDAYFDHNIIANFNRGIADKGYVIHEGLTEQQNADNIDQWKSIGIPDVLIGTINVYKLTDHQASINDYSIVYILDAGYFWKGTRRYLHVPIYVKTSELYKYNINAIQ